jgi:hypothetical protein
MVVLLIRKVWCSGESCLIELLGHGFKVASPYLQGESLPRFIPSSDRTYVGASGNGSARYFLFVNDVKF